MPSTQRQVSTGLPERTGRRRLGNTFLPAFRFLCASSRRSAASTMVETVSLSGGPLSATTQSRISSISAEGRWVEKTLLRVPPDLPLPEVRVARVPTTTSFSATAGCAIWRPVIP